MGERLCEGGVKKEILFRPSRPSQLRCALVQIAAPPPALPAVFPFLPFAACTLSCSPSGWEVSLSQRRRRGGCVVWERVRATRCGGEGNERQSPFDAGVGLDTQHGRVSRQTLIRLRTPRSVGLGAMPAPTPSGPRDASPANPRSPVRPRQIYSSYDGEALTTLFATLFASFASVVPSTPTRPSLQGGHQEMGKERLIGA